MHSRRGTGATPSLAYSGTAKSRKTMSISKAVLLTAILLSAACGAKDQSAKDEGGSDHDDVESTSSAAAPTGKIIVIEMTTDDKGSYFAPKEVEAEPGDVLRFTLVTGVHNAHFVADSNPGVPNLPAATEMLQLPGQTVDVVVPNAVGKTLYYHCDPHAALGMIGHVKIED